MLNEFESELAKRGVSDGRRRDTLHLLRDFETWLANRSLAEARGPDLAAYLAERCNRRFAPGTLRKERQMVLGFFSWAYEEGCVEADALLSLRAVKSPASASGQVQPDPYSAADLRELQEVLKARWPKLPADEARKRVTRWREGLTPYPRIRKHAIRLQLDAVVALCLHGGLRRGELFSLHLDDLHYDNAYVSVWRGERFGSDAREVPYTAAARHQVAEWIEFREAMQPNHERPWLNLWAATTARQEMARETFDKLLVNYVGRPWSFRRLRHTSGVNWLQAGMSIWELQELLGHRRLKDTLPYGEALAAPLEQRVERLDRALTRRLPLAA